MSAAGAGSEREVLDAYFTSYFNAWLDNHDLYSGPKRAVVGFTPRLAMEPANVEHYFAAYPEGTLVSIVRDPRAWYGSAAGHMPEHYGDVDGALGLWNASTDATIAAAERYGERVLVLTYEQLVGDPEATMRRVAGRLGIDWGPSLLRADVQRPSDRRELERPDGAGRGDPVRACHRILRRPAHRRPRRRPVRTGGHALMSRSATASLPWGKPCFPHGPPSSRGRCLRGNLTVPLEPLPSHRPETGR